MPNTESWHSYSIPQHGYLKRIDMEGLTKYVCKQDIQVAITCHVGFLVMEGYPLLKINKTNIEKETLECLSTFFKFYDEDVLDDHYIFGFKQISEIAVKSLSPGINDPGTAIKAIDFLALLLSQRP